MSNERLERQYRRLGTRKPSCVVCGEGSPFCLELHHIAGCKHDDDLSIVCRNCHRKLSDSQKDHEAELGDAPNTAFYLLGLSELLAQIAPRLKAISQSLSDCRQAEGEE